MRAALRWKQTNRNNWLRNHEYVRFRPFFPGGQSKSRPKQTRTCKRQLSKQRLHRRPMTTVCMPLSGHCLASLKRHASRAAIASTLHAACGASDQFQQHTRIKASGQVTQYHFASKSILGCLPLPVWCVSWYASFVPQAVSYCFSDKSASSEDCLFFCRGSITIH